MKKSYGHMAPNAGYGGSSEGVHKMAEKLATSHGSPSNLSDKQHYASTADRHDWGSMAYSQGQDGDGSMNYMSEKMAISAHDAKKLIRARKKDVE